MRVFGRLQQTLLPLHLPHYLRSLGAYGRAGRDFIRSMLLFGFHSMVCVCVTGGEGRGGEWCGGTVTVVMHVCFTVFFFLPLVIHTACILHFFCWLIQQHVFIRCPLLTYLNRFHWCFVRMCRGLWWACTGSPRWLLLHLSSESFKCCLQKGRIKHEWSSTKGFTSVDFEREACELTWATH